MSLTHQPDPIVDPERLFEGFENLTPFRVNDILLVSSLYDSFILREDGRLTAENSGHDGFVKIGVGEKTNLHEERVACSSSRARISFLRRSIGRGSAWRLPSTHFWFCRIR